MLNFFSPTLGFYSLLKYLLYYIFDMWWFPHFQAYFSLQTWTNAWAFPGLVGIQGSSSSVIGFVCMWLPSTTWSSRISWLVRLICNAVFLTLDSNMFALVHAHYLGIWALRMLIYLFSFLSFNDQGDSLQSGWCGFNSALHMFQVFEEKKVG